MPDGGPLHGPPPARRGAGGRRFPEPMTMPSRRLTLQALAAFGGACLLPTARADTTVRELKWSALLPAGWDAKAPLQGLDLDSLEDNDPRAREALARARDYWKSAPVERSLDGVRARLPGYVVPMSGDARIIGEFLLVPYFGACIHVPPPPANQIVHVKLDKPSRTPLRVMRAVWVTGTLRVERLTSAMGDAGYAMHGASVETYTR